MIPQAGFRLQLNKQHVTHRKSVGGLAFRSYSFHEISSAGKLEDYCSTHHQEKCLLIFVARGVIAFLASF
jgi:hypothetical protein